MLRLLVAAPFVVLYTAAFGIAGVLLGLVRREAPAVHRCAVLWGRAVLGALGVRVDLRAAGGPPPRPAVYAANHASALDIPILFACLPEFRIIHKRSLYLIPVLGLYLHVAGHFGIDRGRAFRARRSLDRASERLRAGRSLVVFPEGTRTEEGVGRFKRGSFRLALEAGVPVVPVSIVGVRRVFSGFSARPGTVRVILHPALATAGRSPEAAADLAEEVRRIVAGACEAA